jgi:hypothetical protein
MIRRTFFQSLAASLLPRPLLAAADSVRATCTAPAETPPPPSIHHPEWLSEWRKVQRVEIFPEDLPDHPSPHQRALAAVILQRIATAQPLAFRYHGGTQPGGARIVLPILLFALDYFAHYYFRCDDPGEIPDPDEPPMYLHAWCQTRNAPRIFRLDRMQTDIPGAILLPT